MRIRLISWNVQKRQGTLDRQQAVLAGREPDLIALQEVSIAAQDRWLGWATERFAHHASSFREGETADSFNLVLSRWPLKAITPPEMPFPDRIVSGSVKSPAGPIHLHNAHVPTGGHGWKKIETFEGIHRHLARPSRHHRILCGDFNSPHTETPDKVTIPFGVEDRSERWGKGELSVITGLREYGLPDVFRDLNGWDAPDVSWVWKGRGKRVGRRFDHIFASPSLRAVDCHYHHAWREANLSDHSAIEATFNPPPAALK